MHSSDLRNDDLWEPDDDIVVGTFLALKEFSPDAYRLTVQGLLEYVNDDYLDYEDVIWVRKILLELGEISIH